MYISLPEMESTRGFVFSQANEKCALFIMRRWEKIKTEGGKHQWENK